MSENSDIVDLLTHPVALFSAVFAFVSHGFVLIDPIIQFVGATAGTWFPLLGVLSTLGKSVAMVPAALMQKLFVVGAIVYALYLGEKLLDRVSKFFKKR